MLPTYEQGDRLLALLNGVKTASETIVQKIESLETNVNILNNNVYEVTYREIIDPTATTTGNITFPTESTLDTDDYPGNAILSTITGDNEVEGETPIFNGSPVTAILATNGDWVTSSFTNSTVAIIFRLKVRAIDFINLDQTKIIDFATSGGVGGDVYQGASPTNVNVGGLLAGTNISGLSIQDIIQQMTNTYLAPAFSSFTAIGQNTTVEVGTTLSGNRTFSFSFSNAFNVTASTLNVRDVTANVLIGTGLATTSPTISLPITNIQLNSSGATQQWRGEATNTQSNSFQSSNFTVTGRFLRFFGAVATSPTDSATVRALPNSAFQTANSNTFILDTGTTLTKFVVALPPSRTIDSVIDLTNLNANITSAYILTGTISVNDIGGTPRTYNIYELNVGAPYSVSAQHQIITI
jgi:hypothetical protein